MKKPSRTIRILRIVMPIVAIVIARFTAPWREFLAWVAPLPASVSAQVDTVNDLGLDGVIVYIDQVGQEPALYAAGWKNKLTSTPADPHALFKIASIGKLYIATATAKLVNAQRLSLDDTLAHHLPELEGRIEYADQISVRMLLQHRSGIPNYTDADEFDWFTSQTDPDQNLALVLEQPADFKPDARRQYSNTNYLLLGRILDRVLGYDHQQYIASAILAPLGLRHTFSSLQQVAYKDVVSGYWQHYSDDLRGLEHGSMIATAQDVGIFLRALNDGTLLNDDEQAIYSSVYEYEHTGWVPGYYSIARYHQDLDAVVIQFVSTTGGRNDLDVRCDVQPHPPHSAPAIAAEAPRPPHSSPGAARLA